MVTFYYRRTNLHSLFHKTLNVLRKNNCDEPYLNSLFLLYYALNKRLLYDIHEFDYLIKLTRRSNTSQQFKLNSTNKRPISTYLDLIKNSNSGYSLHRTELVNKCLNKYIYLRRKNYCIQYIIGYWVFKDMKIFCKEPVLVPRTETEKIVDKTILKLNKLFGETSGISKEKIKIKDKNNNIAIDNNTTKINFLEIGVGTGAIYISIIRSLLLLQKSNILNADFLNSSLLIDVEGIDIEKNCLELCYKNTKLNIVDYINKSIEQNNNDPNNLDKQENKICYSFNYTQAYNTEVLEHIDINNKKNNNTIKNAYNNSNFNNNISFLIKKQSIQEYITINKDDKNYVKKLFIVSNPPYIPLSLKHTIPENLNHEAESALFGGETGLEIVLIIIDNLYWMLNNKGFCLMEFNGDSNQISLLKEYIKTYNKDNLMKKIRKLSMNKKEVENDNTKALDKNDILDLELHFIKDVYNKIRFMKINFVSSKKLKK